MTDLTGTNSPRITDEVLGRYPTASNRPVPHTRAELAGILESLLCLGAEAVAIGHGRHAASVATAIALAATWTDGGRTVLDVVNWPASAASWLRPARRLTASQPDAWVVTDTTAGFAQLARRLAEQPTWAAERTFCTASVDRLDLIALVGDGDLTGLRGVTATGSGWRIGRCGL